MPMETELLREAWAEVSRLRDIVAVNDQRLADVWDQSKAEIERLRGLVDTLFQSRAEAESDSDTAFKERDEARAEVERLRQALVASDMRSQHFVEQAKKEGIIEGIRMLQQVIEHTLTAVSKP